MSLRTKMYCAFLAMIAIAMVISGMAINAFFQINRNIERAEGEVSATTKEALPVNSEMFKLATNITAAGLSYYAYMFNHLDEDFNRGNQHLDEVRNASAKVEGTLAGAPSDHLSAIRTTLPKINDELKRLDETTDGLKSAVGKLLVERDAMNKSALAASESIEAMYKDAVERVSAVSELVDDKNALLEALPRRAERLTFLNDVVGRIAAARVSFWQAQASSGAEADAAYGRAIKSLEGAIAMTKEYMASGNIRNDKTMAVFSGFLKHVEEYLAAMRRAEQLNDTVTETSSRAVAIYEGVNAMAGELSRNTDKDISASMDVVRTNTAGIDQIGDFWRLALIVSAGLALAVGLVSATLLVGNIAKPINRIIEAMDNSSTQISGAVHQLASASQELADGANSQAASLEETSSALEEMASMTRQNADNAQKTNDTTLATGKRVEEGAESMHSMARAMREINDKADQVGRIVKTIEDIAFQTNLLALNAAVEAARAGEAGKGFAVVADEVRNLSQRSAQAARDTTELITGTVESVRNGSSIAEALTRNFAEIEEGTRTVSRLVTQIATATNEQAMGVDQVNTAVAQMDKVTQQNAASAEETASLSEELNAQATAFVDIVRELTALVRGKTNSGEPAGPEAVRLSPARPAVKRLGYTPKVPGKTGV